MEQLGTKKENELQQVATKKENYADFADAIWQREGANSLLEQQRSAMGMGFYERLWLESSKHYALAWCKSKYRFWASRGLKFVVDKNLRHKMTTAATPTLLATQKSKDLNQSIANVMG